MSDIDDIEVTFDGGPHDGFIALPITHLGFNGTPTEVGVYKICTSWGDAHRKGESFVGTVMLLPAVSNAKYLERLVQHNQDVLTKYRIDSAEVAGRTLQIVCSYVGTENVRVPSDIQCAVCKADISGELPDTPPEQRKPCPQCGSTKRDFRMAAGTGAFVVGGAQVAATATSTPPPVEADHLAELMSSMVEAEREHPTDPPSLNIVVDSDVDPERLAEFLAQLSSIYSELSGGDELVIVEGKLPVVEEVCV